MATENTTKYDKAITKALILSKVHDDIDTVGEDIESWPEDRLYRFLRNWGYVWDGQAWRVSPDLFDE